MKIYTTSNYGSAATDVKPGDLCACVYVELFSKPAPNHLRKESLMHYRPVGAIYMRLMATGSVTEDGEQRKWTTLHNWKENPFPVMVVEPATIDWILKNVDYPEGYVNMADRTPVDYYVAPWTKDVVWWKVLIGSELCMVHRTALWPWSLMNVPKGKWTLEFLRNFKSENEVSE